MKPCSVRRVSHSGVAWVLLGFALLLPAEASATSQWSRKTGSDCARCHTVFPRLNSFGEQYLLDGYVLPAAHAAEKEDEAEGGLSLGKVEHLLGFRVNVTPIQLETNAFQKDSTSEKSTRITLGNPQWIQFFVAGSIQKHISFFSELEYTASAFKFNWFYWNLTRLGGTRALNAQVGNVSPVEFASYPNRLPQLPALKSEIMRVKTSDGSGEASVDMTSARPGIQYYGQGNWVVGYAGVSPGAKATQTNQHLNSWVGAVLKLPESVSERFAGSTATLHYYTGVDTKNTGPTSPGQIENRFTRLSPQVNIRYNEQIDIQAAYIRGEEENRALVATPTEDFKFDGVVVEAGYMPKPEWHLAFHYDWHESENEVGGVPVLQFHRVVPAVTYVLNENIRGTIYWERDLSDTRDKIDIVTFNVRAMF